ncbi:diaminopimelate epimerase [Mucilaginibacter sp.]|uniref:diaminopimelate epimerase n=1 Tax=Mucilaginibacter sp. TaxID=1882438 RepID=UPI003D10488C
MSIHFYKYQGAGNDFVMIDNRQNVINHHNPQLISQLCNRRFGIGGDGLMCLENEAGYDFKMVYYNADGQPSSMCGNGGRCIVAFAKYLGIINTETNFLAVDGPHYAKISASGDWVSLQMIDVDTITTDNDAYVLDTGSPHYIKLVDGLKDKDVYTDGYAIRNNNTYREKGININFVEPDADGYFVRTYERGVEDETFACGTGVTAVALAMAKHNQQTGHINTPIKVLGGNMNIRFDYDGHKYTGIFLEGPAVKVFDGEITL